ncbi:MAG: extracellular solute-binding protein, partial [Lachnospiraceae bacterium]|nr:extracellular solute-binding protein [Lachnospiraceae bacterium]
MKKTAKRVLAAALMVTMAVSAAGCGSNGSGQQKTTVGAQTTDAAAVTTAAVSSGPVKAGYPLTTEKKQLTVYSKNSLSSNIANYNEIAAFDRAAEKLGVELVWSHPVSGSETDQYNLMIASQDLPDIIFWDFSSTSSKLTGLLDNGSVIDMDPMIRQYAPNYLKALEQDEILKKQALNDEGKLCAMYKLEPTLERLVTNGPIMRKDLLDQYGLEVPMTIEDWYQTLSTFKANGVEAPLAVCPSSKSTHLYFTMSAFKTYYSFYADPETDAVTFGPITENYKAWLKELNRWYEAGLIDPEFNATDRKTLAANMSNGKSAAGAAALSSGIGNYTRSAKEMIPNYELVGCPWPVQTEGDTPYVINYEAAVRVGGMGAVVTSSCEDPVLAVQALDYFYGEEGQDLMNWGIEGETYTVNADGTKTFTDMVMNAPDGQTPAQVMSKYAMPSQGFTKTMDFEAWKQINLSLPEQAEA